MLDDVCKYYLGVIFVGGNFKFGVWLMVDVK